MGDVSEEILDAYDRELLNEEEVAQSTEVISQLDAW